MQAVEIETGSSPVGAVIWLHGLGADGHDFEPVVPELRLKRALRYIFPHAPIRPVTINMGMRMRAWYDILQFGGGPEDAAGIRESQKILEDLIGQETRRGLTPRQIVLAGFSQGGAIALHAGLRHSKRLAGILALSTYLPLASTVDEEASRANRDVPIFMAHGEFDDIIPLRRAEASREMLAKLGYKVEWRAYPMPHSVCAPEIADIAKFLAQVLED